MKRFACFLLILIGFSAFGQDPERVTYFDFGDDDDSWGTRSCIDGKFYDNGKLLLASDFSSIHIINIQDRITAKKIEVGWIHSLITHPSGKFIICGKGDGRVTTWNIKNGEEEGIIKNLPNIVRSLAVSPNGKLLASGFQVKGLSIWDFEKRIELQDFPSVKHGIISLDFNYDGTKLVSSGFSRRIEVWNPITGKLLSYFDKHSDDVLCVKFTPDGTKVISGSKDKTIRIWDVETKKELQILSGHDDYVHTINISPDGSKIVSGSNDSTVVVWDMNSGKILKSWFLNDKINDLCFSQDSKSILVCTSRYYSNLNFAENSVTINMKNYRMFEKKIAQYTNDLQKSKNNEERLARQLDKMVYKFWYYKQKYDSLNISAQKNYSKINIISPNALKYLHQPLKIAQNKINIEAIITTNFSEKLLREALQVRVNGNLQNDKLGNVSLKPQHNDYDFEQNVLLEVGENKIEINIAAPNQEVVSSLPLYVHYTPPLKSNLYLYAVGIESNLNYTDEDAQDIYRIFKSQEGKAFSRVFVENPLIREQTDANIIIEQMQILGNQYIEIRQQDVVIVYFSGHAELINEEFRILGRNYKEGVKIRTIGFKEDILENLNKLTCKKIILFDACHSGLATKGNPIDANKMIAETPAGTVIISSSSGTESSVEDEKWQNGSFTEAIIEGLENGKADFDKDKVIMISELFKYVEKRVPEIVKSVEKYKNKTQTPQMKIVDTQDFPIYLLK